MSWETFIIGDFTFVEGISEEKKQELLSKLENVLEAKIEWDDDLQEYKFRDVNYMSHIKGIEIKGVVRQIKKYLQSFECSIFYLDNPDEEVRFEQDNGDVELIQE